MLLISLAQWSPRIKELLDKTRTFTHIYLKRGKNQIKFNLVIYQTTLAQFIYYYEIEVFRKNE